MFCPECGNQNPDSAKFCISCGHKYGQASAPAGGPMPQQFVGTAQKRSSGSLWIVLGVLGFLIIGGAVAFLVLRNSAPSGEGNPTPRVKASPTQAATPANAAMPTNAAPTAINAPGATSPASNTSASTPGSTNSSAAPKPTTPPPAKAAKKPVNCDKKCYGVYDQCMADYRQFADNETICRGRQTTCLSKC